MQHKFSPDEQRDVIVKVMTQKKKKRKKKKSHHFVYIYYICVYIDFLFTDLYFLQ